MLLKLVMSGLTIVALCSSAHAAPEQWAGNNHWYEAVYVGPQGINWTDAQNAAGGAGGHLATITSDGENAFVFGLADANPLLWYTDGFGNSIGPWLGGYQPAGSPEPGGGWTWDVTGEAWVYENWAGPEPNNSGGTEHYLELFGVGPVRAATWNDLSHDVPVRGYILEIVPEPATLSLLAVGGLVALRRRRR
jgi:hypothetical protein